jgi:hypothetical protein
MRRAIIGATGVALAVALGLAGCGSATEESIEEAIEQGTGGDVEIEDDGLSFTDDEGNEVRVGDAAEVPDAWPEDAPVPQGTILSSTTTGGTTTLLVTVAGTPQETFEALTGEFADQGWAEESTTEFGGLYSATYTKDDRTGSITVLDGGDGNSAVTIAIDGVA